MKIQKKLFFFLVIFFIFLLALSMIIKIIKTNKKQKSSVLPPQEKTVRRPAVAGSFYPADSQQLNTKLKDFLNQAEPISVTGKLRILIVPHAGIDYSGRVAAWGFKQVEGGGYKQVILLGASHRAYFDHVAVDDSSSWETPRGSVEIDQDLVKAIVEENKKIVNDSVPHKEEHSLEIELIFLQKVLSDFKIVPILVSQPSEETIDYLAQKISQNLDEETLLVVSTDLSHYPSWETAVQVDNRTIEAILLGKKDDLEPTIKDIESKNYPNLVTAACGYQPIRIALRVAEILKLSDFKKIKYENSGDISGDKSRVVGYAAIGVFSEKINTDSPQLDDQAQKEATKIARTTLAEYINNRQKVPITSQNQVLSQSLGAFVTLRKDGQLRGCIGKFEPSEPLYQVIQEMTIAAATEDVRFPPVRAEELSEIKIEISVMSPKKRISSWKEVKLGKHGVVIQKDGRGGTFLPQVAKDTGWTLEEFLGQLCSQKAGLSPDCYKDPTTAIYTFEAQIFEEE